MRSVKKFCTDLWRMLMQRFRPKGHWKFADHDGYWYNECSICGGKTENHDGSPPDFNFCPYCGKPMGV